MSEGNIYINHIWCQHTRSTTTTRFLQVGMTGHMCAQHIRIATRKSTYKGTNRFYLEKTQLKVKKQRAKPPKFSIRYYHMGIQIDLIHKDTQIVDVNNKI
jgi:hypothetical protein